MKSARATLLEEARSADLLVIARSSRGEPKTSSYVARHAACPVVLVPNAARD